LARPAGAAAGAGRGRGKLHDLRLPLGPRDQPGARAGLALVLVQLVHRQPGADPRRLAERTGRRPGHDPVFSTGAPQRKLNLFGRIRRISETLQRDLRLYIYAQLAETSAAPSAA